MLTRQRVVSAQLGEDRDHHAAEQILAAGVLLGGQHHLKLLERLFGIPAVPGREGCVKLVRARTVP